MGRDGGVTVMAGRCFFVMPGLDPGIPTGTVEACSGCFGSAGAGGHGPIKPAHAALEDRASQSSVTVYGVGCDDRPGERPALRQHGRKIASLRSQ
jgi:hypothetical protein